MKVSPKGPTLILLLTALAVLILGITLGGAYLGVTKGSLGIKEASPIPEVKVVVDEERDKVEFKETDQLPDNFPADFPVYKKAKMEGYWSADGESLEGISVIWRSDDEASSVITFYKSELLKNGWEMTTVFEDARSGTFTITKEGREGFVGITREGEETIISVTVGLPQ